MPDEESTPEESTPVVTDKKKRTRDWSADDTIALGAVAAMAAFARGFRLGNPKEFVFDEVYYAKEACFYVKASEKLCDFPKTPPAEVHPPLGKWLMSVGIELFGFNSVGWRVVSVVFGVLTVILLYLLARKLLHSTLGATLAAGLLAFDPLHFVHSRTALLDLYPAAFGVAAFLFVLYDRDRMLREESDGRSKGMLARPWRVAAGLAAGAATASKWSGGLILIGVILLTIAWEIGRRRDSGRWQALFQTIRHEGLSIVLYLGLIPFMFYVVTYIGRLQGPVLDPLAEGSWAREWLRYQTTAFSFHRGLDARHGYESPPIMWILMKRPLLYWAEQSGGQKSSIYAFGNPLIWWPSIVAFAYLFVAWVRKRDWRGPSGFVLLAFAITYLTWLVLAPNRQAVFLFYILPAVPFMCLAIATVITRFMKGTVKTVAVVVTAVFSIGWFFAYYPIIANVPVPQERWDTQMLFNSCDKPTVRIRRTGTVTQAIDRNTTIVKTNVKTRTDNKDIPPSGWCWD